MSVKPPEALSSKGLNGFLDLYMRYGLRSTHSTGKPLSEPATT